MILSDKRWIVYSTILLIQAFCSLKVWFFWWIPDESALLIFGLINFMFMIMVPSFWQFRDIRRVRVAILIFILFFYRTNGNIFAYVFSMFPAMSLAALVFLKKNYQIDLLERFQKTITIILSVTLLFWLGHLLGFDLPSFDISYGTIDRGHGIETQYFFKNHLLYLVDQTWFLHEGFIPGFLRFSSVFLEPGYLAIIMVFLLFINRFDLKDRRNLLYIAVIIASISLAGFLMGVLAYIAHGVQYSKHGVRSLIIIAVLLIGGFNFFRDYNHGDNFVNHGIIERLEYDQTEGTIAGNNRTSVALDDHFDKFVKTSNIWFGEKSGETLEFGVGYKAFLIRYGICGLFLFLTYMGLIARLAKNYRSTILFILYILMFVRGDVTMFWHGFMLVYVCGVIYTKYSKKSYEKNSTRLTVQRV